MGAGGQSAIATLVERHTRFVPLARLEDGHGTGRVVDAITERIGTLLADLARSLTWDQGLHHTTTEAGEVDRAEWCMWEVHESARSPALSAAVASCRSRSPARPRRHRRGHGARAFAFSAEQVALMRGGRSRVALEANALVVNLMLLGRIGHAVGGRPHHY
jgi:hypothetical protein